MTNFKAFKHAMRFALSLALVAWTNNGSALTHESPIDLPNGCTIYQHQLAGAVTVYRSEGPCKNGLAEGVWNLGGRTDSGTRFFSISGRKAGKASGALFVISDRGLATIRVTEPDNKENLFGTLVDRGESTVRLQDFLSAIDKANTIARSMGLPTIDAAKAKAIVRSWHQGSDSIFDQWITGPGTTPPWEYGVSKSSRFTQNSEPTPTLPDDPKTTGRSAVHPEELQRQAEERRLADERRAENQRRIEENQARRQREKEEREARELGEMTEALQQLSNSLGNLRRK